jgi:PEGA domain
MFPPMFPLSCGLPFALPRCLFLVVVSFCLLILLRAESLKIKSNPPGTTVELDGVPVGTTPFEKEFPGGYFHRTRTAFGQRLEHAMFARVSLSGYATRKFALTKARSTGSICTGGITTSIGCLSPTSSTPTWRV